LNGPLQVLIELNNWSGKNEKNPRELFQSSGKKVWFDCNNRHSFETQLSRVSIGQ
jgi:hypothetical protein